MELTKRDSFTKEMQIALAYKAGPITLHHGIIRALNHELPIIQESAQRMLVGIHPYVNIKSNLIWC